MDLLILLKLILKLVSILIRVAFLTFLEQKVIGFSQSRKGPRKVGWLGLLQPFGDAVKLEGKDLIYPRFVRKMVYAGAPLLRI